MRDDTVFLNSFSLSNQFVFKQTMQAWQGYILLSGPFGEANSRAKWLAIRI